MSLDLQVLAIEKGPRRRHDARVQRFSTNPGLLERLDALAADEGLTNEIVGLVCDKAGVEYPHVKFHAARSPYTGLTEPPRWQVVAAQGDAAVVRYERQAGRVLPLHGAIRIGRTTTLMTVAHELGHHLVFTLEPPSTPAHGKRWVDRFDEAAAVIDGLVASLITR